MAPNHVQLFMDSLLADENCRVYIDDVLIRCVEGDNEQDIVASKIEILNERNIKLNLSKCIFFAQELPVLGHILSPTGVRVDPHKLDALRAINRPTTGKKWQQFAGQVNYIRNFSPKFAELMAPLDKLRNISGKITWHKDLVDAYDKLKKFLVEEEFWLAPIDFNKPFVLTTDASDYAVSGWLGQWHGNHLRPVMCVSTKLDKAQSNYEPTQKELYAVLFAIEKFEEFLGGKHFTIRTDHRALQWILNNPLKASSLDVFKKYPKMIDRWLDVIFRFDIFVERTMVSQT
jgi:hypothetical protein